MKSSEEQRCCLDKYKRHQIEPWKLLKASLLSEASWSYYYPSIPVKLRGFLSIPLSRFVLMAWRERGSYPFLSFTHALSLALSLSHTFALLSSLSPCFLSMAIFFSLAPRRRLSRFLTLEEMLVTSFLNWGPFRVGAAASGQTTFLRMTYGTLKHHTCIIQASHLQRTCITLGSHLHCTCITLKLDYTCIIVALYLHPSYITLASFIPLNVSLSGCSQIRQITF